MCRCRGTPSHSKTEIRLKTNNVDTGRRIANTLPEGGLNANRKNHGTGFSGDRAFSRPPLGMLHRRTPDGAPRPRPARRADAGTPPDAARSPRPAGFRPSPSRFSPNPRHGRLTWPPNSLRTESKNPTPSRPGARWKWSAFHAIAELVEFPDHPRCACAFGLGTYRRTPLLVAHPLVQNQPKQSAKPMGNGPDGLLVSQARQQPVKCQFKYAPFDLVPPIEPPDPEAAASDGCPSASACCATPLRSLRCPDTPLPTRTAPWPLRKPLPGDRLRRSSVAPNPTRNRALPPRVAPRPDALALGPWPPAPVARCASRSTPTPPAPSSAADGKLHPVAGRRPARRAIVPAWPAAGNRPWPPERPGRFRLPPVPSTCAGH